MPICKIGSYKIAIIENKIVETSTEVQVGSAKKVLTGALLDGIGNVDNNANNSSTILVSQVGGSTNLVLDSGIVKVLTENKFGNAEEILTGVLPNKVKNANDMATGREPKR